MQRHISAAAALLGLALASSPHPTHAHGSVGDREFPATLIVDDPAVKDEASIPTILYAPNGPGEDGPRGHETDFDFEVDKTITERLGIGVNDGYTVLRPAGEPRRFGWQNVVTTLKYQAIVDPPHEFLGAVGVVREWGGTGAKSIGAEPHGATTPTLYFGKGLGDLSIGSFRPLAITGTFGYRLPDSAEDGRQLAMGLSVQYSMPYLADAMNVDLPDAVARLTPLVEFNYTTPLSRTAGATTLGTVAPGVIYTTEAYQLGLEALIPTTRAAGRGIGVIAQYHVFFGEFFPALGKPLL